MSRNLKFTSVVVVLGVLALYSAYAAAFFSWITADPPVGMPGGGSRSHTIEELQHARTWANVWFAVFVTCVVTLIGSMAAWFKGRHNPAV